MESAQGPVQVQMNYKAAQTPAPPDKHLLNA